MIRNRDDESEAMPPPKKMIILEEQDDDNVDTNQQLSEDINLFPDVWASERAFGQSQAGLVLVSNYLVHISINKLVKIKRISIEYENHPSVKSEPRQMTMNWPPSIGIENYYREKIVELQNEYEECKRNVVTKSQATNVCELMKKYKLKWSDAIKQLRYNIEHAINKREYRRFRIQELERLYVESMAGYSWGYGATFKADEFEFDHDGDGGENE